MKHVLALTVAAFSLLLPAATPAVAASDPTQYATALTAIYGSPSPYTGTLKLTISDAGIVRGYYFSSDGSAAFVPVTGGQRGDTIWFDIGNNGMYHVDGRVRDGSIVGTAFARDDEQFTFVATAQR
ncbi:MAG TPA: hypothetical protein VIO32_10375 [Candidatus Baltobacteraceae bacterium]